MKQRAGDVIRDVRHHAPHSIGGEEWLKVNVQRIAVDEGQVSTCDLPCELLLEPREKIIIKFDCNHPRTRRQEAFGQYAEPRTNLQHDLTSYGTSGRDDRVEPVARRHDERADVVAAGDVVRGLNQIAVASAEAAVAATSIHNALREADGWTVS